jgi:hypothetical protein
LCIAIALQVNARSQIVAGASDFSSFYAAGQIIRSGNGAHLYEYETQRRAQQQFSYRSGPLLFPHAPFETILYAPLSLLSYWHAYLFWWSCNLALVLLTLAMMARSFTGIRALLPYWILALAFFTPLQVALVQGQDSVLTMFLLAACLVMLAKGRDASAGAVLALILYKPQLVLPIFLVLAVGLSWRFVYGFVAGAMGLAGISAALIGWRALASLPRFLAWFNALPVSISGADPRVMANVRGVLLQSGVNASQAVVAMVSAAMLLLAMAAVGVGRPSKTPLTLRFALAVSVAAMTSYHLIPHDLTILIVPFLLAVHELAAAPIMEWQTTTATVATAMLMLFPCMGPNPRLIFLGMAVFSCSFWMEMRRRNGLSSVADSHALESVS